MSKAHGGTALALLALMAGCASKADYAKIDAATGQLFAQLANHQYAQIYEAAAPEMKSAMAEPIFIGFMQRVDRRMGACQRPAKAMQWRVNATPGAYFVTQGYTAACANGQLSLTVTIVLRQGVAKLVGFYANSPLLMTD